MIKPSTSLLTLSLLSLGLIGCGDAPEPTEVRSRLSTELARILRETHAAQQGATAELPGLGAFGMLESALGQSSESSTSFRVMQDLTRRITGTATAPRHGLAPADPVEDELDTDAMVDYLNTTIFTDANHVGDGIYDIPSSLACTSTIIDENGDETEETDPDCVQSWDKIDLRIRVAEDGDTLRFAFQVGANHDEPLELGLASDELSLTVDLDEAEAATETLASAFGEQAPNARLAGRVTGALTVLGTAHVEASLTVNRAIAIAVADDGVDLDGADATRFSTAAGKIIAVELNGGAGSGAFELGIGETAVHIPGEESFDLDLAGATLRAEATAGQLSLTNVSLGNRTTTVKRNGALALSVDLNPDDGRTLNATITGDATTGEATLEVSPKLDARMTVNHAADDFTPVYDVTRVLLDGSLHGAEGTDALEVLSGTFAISTNPASYGFTANAGQCVLGTEAYDDTSGQYYTSFEVATCQ